MFQGGAIGRKDGWTRVTVYGRIPTSYPNIEDDIICHVTMDHHRRDLMDALPVLFRPRLRTYLVWPYSVRGSS